jgi:hypothetical protein
MHSLSSLLVLQRLQQNSPLLAAVAFPFWVSTLSSCSCLLSCTFPFSFPSSAPLLSPSLLQPNPPSFPFSFLPRFRPSLSLRARSCLCASSFFSFSFSFSLLPVINRLLCPRVPHYRRVDQRVRPLLRLLTNLLVRHPPARVQKKSQGILRFPPCLSRRVGASSFHHQPTARPDRVPAHKQQTQKTNKEVNFPPSRMISVQE